MEEVEEWKEVKDSNGKYIVSSFGRVWNKVRNVECKIRVDKVGYCHVSINCKGVSLHRLVALTFIPNPENKPTVNHKNAIKGDNRVPNLEWATRKEQSQHISENRLHPKSTYCCIVDNNDNIIEIFNSLISLSKKIGVNEGNIFQACEGKIGLSKGLKIRYYNIDNNNFTPTRFDYDKIKTKGEYKRKIYCEYNDKIYNTQMECSKDLNIQQGVISRILLGKQTKNEYGIRFLF